MLTESGPSVPECSPCRRARSSDAGRSVTRSCARVEVRAVTGVPGGEDCGIVPGSHCLVAVNVSFGKPSQLHRHVKGEMRCRQLACRWWGSRARVLAQRVARSRAELCRTFASFSSVMRKTYQFLHAAAFKKPVVGV